MDLQRDAFIDKMFTYPQYKHTEMAQIYRTTKDEDPEEFRRFVEYMSSRTNKSWSISLESILIGSCQYGITRIVKCLFTNFPLLDIHFPVSPRKRFLL